MAQSGWTTFLGGGKDDSENTRPLLPDSNAPDTSQSSYGPYPSASAPTQHPGAQPSGTADLESPEPVNPRASQPPEHQCCEHAGPQHAPQPSHQEGAAPPPVYEAGHVADGHPVLPRATNLRTFMPPLVVNQNHVLLEPLRGSPIVVTCPHCGHNGPVAASKEPGTVTWNYSMVLFLLGCNILSLLPFCIDGTKDWVYRCHHCRLLFGRELP